MKNFLSKITSKFKKPENISFHPRLSSVLDLITGVVFLFVFLNFVFSWWMVLLWIVLRFLWWCVLSNFTYYPKHLDCKDHLVILTFFNLGTFLLLLFVEWEFSKWLLKFILILGPAISFWLIPEKNSILNLQAKPFRRILLILTLLGTAGFWSGIGAIMILKVFLIPNYLLLIFASVLTVFISTWWWKLYGIKINQRLYIWMGILTLILLEIGWVMILTPIGYVVYGIIIGWLWYLLWLMARFHLSDTGIIWKKQVPFLSINAFLLLIFFLFLVKWK